jgi:acetyl esterase/lipase
VKTPVLLLHWEGDLRCPIGQSEEIFQGLKILHKPVEFIRYPGGFHGVRTPSQAVDQTRRTIAWYDRYTSRRKAARRPVRRRRTVALSRNGARANGRPAGGGRRRAPAAARA